MYRVEGGLAGLCGRLWTLFFMLAWPSKPIRLST
jgi:hypothetical protein